MTDRLSFRPLLVRSGIRSFTELERSLRASDGLKSHKQSDSADGNGGDTSAAFATAPSTEASPGPQATSTNITS